MQDNFLKVRIVKLVAHASHIECLLPLMVNDVRLTTVVYCWPPLGQSIPKEWPAADWQRFVSSFQVRWWVCRPTIRVEAHVCDPTTSKRSSRVWHPWSSGPFKGRRHQSLCSWDTCGITASG